MKKFESMAELMKAIEAKCVANFKAGITHEQTAKELTKAGYTTIRGGPIHDTIVSKACISAGYRKLQRMARKRGGIRPIAREPAEDNLRVLTDLLSSNLGDDTKRVLLKNMGLNI